MQKTVDEKCKSARRSLWTIVRLREAGFPVDKLVHVYTLNIRSILEYIIVAILPLLTLNQLNQLESIQRKATSIILRNYDMSYEERLKYCKLQSLRKRWETLFLKFAHKTVQSERFQNWIKPNSSVHQMSLRKNTTFHLPICRTERYRKSTINTIIRAVNESDKFEITYED